MTAAQRIAAIAALVSLIGLAGCGGNPAAPQGNYGTIMGIVKSSSGQPIAGATVSADSVLTAKTGSDGKYTIQTVPVDSSSTTTSVTCSASGFQSPPQQNVTVAAGKQYEVDFTLNPQ